MQLTKFALVAGLAFGLIGCVPNHDRTANGTPAEQPTSPQHAAIGPINVAKVSVTVPATLKVSEAHRYYPMADIVWRGEPVGNRHAQVGQIFKEAAARGTAPYKKGSAVTVEIEVARFHAVTEMTRTSIGGVHSMRFFMTVKDAKTGRVIAGPRYVIADTNAAGGQRAVNEDKAGRTQRVVVVERLAQVVQNELYKLQSGATATP